MQSKCTWIIILLPKKLNIQIQYLPLQKKEERNNSEEMIEKYKQWIRKITSPVISLPSSNLPWMPNVVKSVILNEPSQKHVVIDWAQYFQINILKTMQTNCSVWLYMSHKNHTTTSHHVFLTTTNSGTGTAPWVQWDLYMAVASS